MLNGFFVSGECTFPGWTTLQLFINPIACIFEWCRHYVFVHFGNLLRFGQRFQKSLGHRIFVVRSALERS